MTPKASIRDTVSPMDYKSRSYRIDDDVHAAILALPESLNQYLRRNLLFAAPKKKSKKAIQVEALRASDPMADERPEIDYAAADVVPTGGSVSVVGAARPVARLACAPHDVHSGVLPKKGCPDCAKMAEERK